MPLTLKDLPDTGEEYTRDISIDDTGILVLNRPQSKYGNIKHPNPKDVLYWLNGYADDYWKLKNPELEDSADNEELKAEQSEELSENDKTGNIEVKTENTEETNDSKEKDPEKKEESKTTPTKPKYPSKKRNSTPIKFILRNISLENPNAVFVASNLEDPGDYLHYVFGIMADAKDKKWAWNVGRVMPVHGMCLVNQPYAMEDLTKSIIEKTINKDDHTQRFSICYYDSMDANMETAPIANNQNHVNQKDAISCVRNCIWAANPNCIQCIKYQDIAFCIDVIKPFFVIGYLYDFARLRKYHTFVVHRGVDTTCEGDDSEDDISDDPTLDEDEDIKRKMRIKSRKRRAARAQLGAGEGGDKKISKIEDADGEEDEDDKKEDDDENIKEETSTETNGINGDAH